MSLTDPVVRDDNKVAYSLRMTAEDVEEPLLDSPESSRTQAKVQHAGMFLPVPEDEFAKVPVVGQECSVLGMSNCEYRGIGESIGMVQAHDRGIVGECFQGPG